jgi:stage II sporulation protein M
MERDFLSLYAVCFGQSAHNLLKDGKNQGGKRVEWGVRQRFFTHIKAYGLVYIALFGVFVIGLLFGFFAPTSMEMARMAEARGEVADFLKYLPAAGIGGTAEFWRFLQLNAIFLLIIWAAGLSLIGPLLLIPAIFYKGFSLGLAIGFLLNYHAAKGAVIILLAILPAHIVLLPLLFFAAVQSFSFSLALIKRNDKSFDGLWQKVLRYSARFSVILCGMAVAALIQGYLSPLLLQMFFALI